MYPDEISTKRIALPASVNWQNYKQLTDAVFYNATLQSYFQEYVSVQCQEHGHTRAEATIRIELSYLTLCLTNDELRAVIEGYGLRADGLKVSQTNMAARFGKTAQRWHAIQQRARYKMYNTIFEARRQRNLDNELYCQEVTAIVHGDYIHELGGPDVFGHNDQRAGQTLGLLLNRNAIYYIDQLVACTADEIRRFRGVGPTVFDAILALVESQGMTLAE